jgi:hypothetical protein
MRCLAHLSSITLDIKDIVCDLESKTQKIGKFCQSQQFITGSTRQSRTTANCRNEKCSCFACMQLTQFFFTDLPAFGIKINDLTADHTEVSGTHCHFAHSFDQNFRRYVFLFQHHFKSKGQ